MMQISSPIAKQTTSQLTYMALMPEEKIMKLETFPCSCCEKTGYTLSFPLADIMADLNDGNLNITLDEDELMGLYFTLKEQICQ